MKYLILVLIFVSNSAFACKNVQYVTTGTPAPCVGYHVNETQMQKFAKQDDLLELSKRAATLDLAEIEYLKKRATKREEELNREENKRFLYTAGAFVLGVVMTGIAAKAAIESSK